MDGPCIVKVFGHVVVGPNVVVGRMKCWDGLCKWAGHGQALVCLSV